MTRERRRSGWRGRLAGVVCAGAVAILAAGALGRPGVVKTKDGGSFRGDVSETPASVVVKIANIPTTLPREQVESVTYDDDFERGIDARLAKLKPDDAEGHVRLAREAYDAGKYQVARRVLQPILEVNPNQAEAYELYNLAGAQMALERRREEASTRPAAAAAPPATAVGAGREAEAAGGAAGKFLSAGEVNAIREGELTERDVNARIGFANNVQTRYAISQGIDPRQFRLASPLRQFLEVRKNGTPEMMRDVRVLSDPLVMMEFKRSVQPAVLSGCAASGCHSALNFKGDFAVYPQQDDAATYTNFFIMTSYSRNPGGKAAAGGAVGLFGNAGGEQRMVDRSQPDLSLVLQFGLPVGVAKYDHPLVKGQPVRAMYRGVSDMKYQAILGWVMGLNPVMPEYDFSIKLPGAGGATAAAGTAAGTQPAGGATMLEPVGPAAPAPATTAPVR